MKAERRLLEFRDFTPPAVPSHEEQVHALQRGLGRAVLWAKSKVLDSDLLLEACLTDLRFDRSFEDCRGDWLWDLVTYREVQDQFREPILEALQTLSDGENSDQLCQLALHYARSGDQEFREQLYEIVRSRRVSDDSGTGESQLLELEGLTGFEFIVQLRGTELQHRDWESDDFRIAEEAKELLGELAVQDVFSKSQQPAVIRFGEAWEEEALYLESRKQKSQSGDSYAERMKAISVEELFTLAARNEIATLIGWGRESHESELMKVQERLLEETNPQTLTNLLRVFRRAPFPDLNSQVVDLFNHPEEAVRRAAVAALEENRHPLVRELALRVAHEPESHDAPGLLILNFAPGDELMVESSLTWSDDSDTLHGMLMSVLQLLEKNETAEVSRLGMLIYFYSPCPVCRSRIVQLLLRKDVFPEWLRHEVQFDAESECRESNDVADLKKENE